MKLEKNVKKIWTDRITNDEVFQRKINLKNFKK